MKKSILLPFALTYFAILFYTACSDKPKDVMSAEETKALTLMQTYCFACHTPDLDIDRRLGPPIFKIREHYYSEQISREEFIDKIVRYASNPSEANSIMPGAIRNFGLMPKQVFKEEDLKVIAGYIYDHDLSSDAWYATWDIYKTKVNPTGRAMTYEERGASIVNNAKTHLVKHLMDAMSASGSEGAVTYCNTHALALTDSVARVNNATIKRVSDQPRNAANAANENELAYIQELKSRLAQNEALSPKIFINNGKMAGYYPIVTAKMCIQCHGIEGTDIAPATLERIKSLYPDDKATGYAENQLRGLFVVEMD